MYRSVHSAYGTQSEMAYPHSFYDLEHGGHQDSPVLCIPNELDVGSTTELAPPPARRVTLHGKRPSMAWAPPPAMISATSLSHYGRPQDETWITSVYRGLRTVGTDGVATVVATLALCFFIGLAIWSMSAVQDQWDGDGLDSAEDADARLHVEVYGGEPSSPLARVHDKIPKIDWKITVATRGLRSSKSSSTTTELPTMALTNPAIVLSAGDVEGPEDPYADGDESHESVERDDDDDSMARLTSTALDTTVTVGSKRVHITRRQRPSKKHRHSAKHTKPQNQASDGRDIERIYAKLLHQNSTTFFAFAAGRTYGGFDDGVVAYRGCRDRSLSVSVGVCGTALRETLVSVGVSRQERPVEPSEGESRGRHHDYDEQCPQRDPSSWTGALVPPRAWAWVPPPATRHSQRESHDIRSQGSQVHVVAYRGGSATVQCLLGFSRSPER
ncbi:hypothetical protein HPB51_013782 [Rhipicephalus microplus]|uniref:Transmembrane protein n=1 Tax=Rhipicephalus microplus TaxID=6941 RepID=A0A9J6F2W8_RHIMP|nr:hypothetical protein HPB51_013782 [Rhipicephalus microplus]